MIGIIDYGMGNLGSVANAFEHLGWTHCLVSQPSAMAACDRLVLPGVGAFAQAMANLERGGWPEALRQEAKTGKPLLGICLGMQLLFDNGEEHGRHAGLGLLPGRVVALRPMPPLRIPHVGWNGLLYARTHPVFDGVKEHIDFYFVHSFHCLPATPDLKIAECDYGGRFTAVAGSANVLGIQFHPEKSQDMGLKILDNFATWNGAC